MFVIKDKKLNLKKIKNQNKKIKYKLQIEMKYF